MALARITNKHSWKMLRIYSEAKKHKECLPTLKFLIDKDHAAISKLICLIIDRNIINISNNIVLLCVLCVRIISRVANLSVDHTK